MDNDTPTTESIRADWDEYIDTLGPQDRAMTPDEFLAVFYDTEEPETLAVVESLSADWFE